MENSPGRLHNLDYLRGLSAFAIMIYHYTGWAFGHYDASGFMGRIGIYGVSIFYILSGLTLFHVYHANLNWKVYFRKRILRIFPLLWLATVATLVVHRMVPDLLQLTLNLTGLFGFVKVDAYYAEGAWSIGNELVFYVFFPIFLWLSAKSKYMMAFVGLFVAAIYVYFAFYLLDPDLPLTNQWTTYINPLNQLWLFVAGIMIGMVFKYKTFPRWLSISLIGGGLVFFISYPITGDQVQLITGYSRLLFSLFCICICVGFYKLRISTPAFIDRPLSKLGEASYSIYLLHPIMWWMSFMGWHVAGKAVGLDVSGLMIILAAVPATLFVSWLVYKNFETYFMKKGKWAERKNVHHLFSYK